MMEMNLVERALPDLSSAARGKSRGKTRVQHDEEKPREADLGLNLMLLWMLRNSCDFPQL